mgnify:CR=1 FL=1
MRTYVVNFHGSVGVNAHDEVDAFEAAEDEIEKGWANIDFDEVECEDYDTNDERI